VKTSALPVASRLGRGHERHDRREQKEADGPGDGHGHQREEDPVPQLAQVLGQRQAGGTAEEECNPWDASMTTPPPDVVSRACRAPLW
jgi:hypothetical protein